MQVINWILCVKFNIKNGHLPGEIGDSTSFSVAPGSVSLLTKSASDLVTLNRSGILEIKILIMSNTTGIPLF